MTTAPLIRQPLHSEKATRLGEGGKYVFLVAPGAAKGEIKKEIARLYRVTVTSVAIIREKPKRRRYRGIAVRKHRGKKAIVTLKKGQAINIGA
jgi:large subunit ribosomal protein L23